MPVTAEVIYGALLIIVGSALVSAFLATGPLDVFELAKNRFKLKAYLKYFLKNLLFTGLLATLALLFGTVMLVISATREYGTEWILRLINSSFTVPVAMLRAVGLFWFRCRTPRLFGLGEICAAVSSIYAAVSAPGDNVGVKVLSILAGMYLFVRGLDNLDKSFKENRHWNIFF